MSFSPHERFSFYEKAAMKKAIILISSLVIIFIVYAYNIYGFLAPNNSVDADILVIEGWIPNQFLEQAAHATCRLSGRHVRHA